MHSCYSSRAASYGRAVKSDPASEENLARIAALKRAVAVLPLSDRVADLYGQNRAALERRSPGRGPPYWKSRVLRRQALGDEDDGQGRWVPQTA